MSQKSMGFENVRNVRPVLHIFWSCSLWWGSNNRKRQFLEIRTRLLLSVLHLGKSFTIPQKKKTITMNSLPLVTLEILLVNGIFPSPRAWLTNSNGAIPAGFTGREPNSYVATRVVGNREEKKVPVVLRPEFHFMLLPFQSDSRDASLTLEKNFKHTAL